MDPIMELIIALNSVTAALERLTAKTTEEHLKTYEEIVPADPHAADPPPKEEPKKRSKAKPKADPPPEEEKKPVTFEELRRILSEKTRAGYTEDIRVAIQSLGADKLSEIKPEDYEKLLKEVEAIGNA